MRGRIGSVSGCDRGHQRLGPDDVHDPCQIIGQDRESHLGGYFWKCVAPMRAFIVPNGCSTVSRRWRMAYAFASILHSLDHKTILARIPGSALPRETDLQAHAITRLDGVYLSIAGRWWRAGLNRPVGLFWVIF
jgi:hypothetical protein